MGDPRRRPASLGRRALPALVMSGGAIALLSALDRPSSGGAQLSAGASGAAVSVVATPPVSGTADASDASGATSTSDPPQTSATATTQAAGTTSTTTTEPVATSGPAAGDCSDATTYDGPVVTTRWGPVQVRAAVLADGSICDVQTLQSPSSHDKSVAINTRALPVLHDEVIQAQIADVDYVSGATITSSAYEQSLQAILDGAV